MDKIAFLQTYQKIQREILGLTESYLKKIENLFAKKCSDKEYSKYKYFLKKRGLK